MWVAVNLRLDHPLELMVMTTVMAPMFDKPQCPALVGLSQQFVYGSWPAMIDWLWKVVSRAF